MPNRFILTAATLVLLGCGGAAAQSRLSLGLQVSPKLCAGNNTSINIDNYGLLPDNEADGHAAFGPAIDFQLHLTCRVGARDFVLLGVGTFGVAQKFRPSRVFFGAQYRNERRTYNFVHFPLEYYRYLGAQGKIRFYGSAGVDFVSDLIQNRPVYSSDLSQKNRGRVENGRVEYRINHLNMETFNVLASCAVQTECAVSRHWSLSAALQLKQGFRPLITSATYFLLDDPSTGRPYRASHVTSISNGQGIALNLGFRYAL